MILGGPTAGAWVALPRHDRPARAAVAALVRRARQPRRRSRSPRSSAALTYARRPREPVRGDRRPRPRRRSSRCSSPASSSRASRTASRSSRSRSATSQAGATASLGIVVDDFRRETLLEVALIWILVIAFATVGWWAPLVIGLGVVAYLAPATARGRRPADAACTRRRRSSRRSIARSAGCGWGSLPGGTMVMFDLDGFSEFNNRYFVRPSATR